MINLIHKTMKKLKLNILQVFIILFSVTVFFSSCNEGEKELFDSNEKVSYESLVNFNSNLNNKGFWDVVGQIAAVAGADILGAAGGVIAVSEVATILNVATGGTVLLVGAGVVCGAGASYATGNALKSISEPINLFFTPPTGYETFDIGYIHNRALDDVYFGNISKIDFLYSNIKNREAVDFMLENSDYIYGYDSIVSKSTSFNRHGDIDVLIEDLFNDNLLSLNMKIFFNHFFNALSRSSDEDNLNSIIDFYTNHIIEEPYSELEKQALISSMSVTVNSFNYWSNKI